VQHKNQFSVYNTGSELLLHLSLALAVLETRLPQGTVFWSAKHV